MTLKKTSIILCTYNEAYYVKDTIEKIQKTIKNLELIIVDDDSKDRTREIINELNSENKIKLIHRKKTRGLASAFFAGLMEATGDYVGWIDTNMSELVVKFEEMDSALESGNDIAILSRYIEGGEDKRNLLRSLSSKYFNLLCGLLLGPQIKDYTTGIFLFKSKVLHEVPICAYGHGEFVIEFLENAKRKSFKIKEIPFIQMKDDDLNVSKTAGNLIRFFYLGFTYFLRILRILTRKN